jgi:hypothetical protein
MRTYIFQEWSKARRIAAAFGLEAAQRYLRIWGWSEESVRRMS